jgi:RND family efflux transporter MFP subunit
MNRLPTTETVPNEQGQRLSELPASPHPNPPPPVGGGQGEGESRKRAGRRVLALGGLAIVVLGGGLVAGTLPRLRQERAVNAAAAAVSVAPPKVTVTVVHTRAGNAERVLPGNSLPLMEASLFARTTGYLKRRLVDIGDRVTEGQLLAEISAPDIDDQLAQAKANLNQAEATLKLNQANAVLAKTVLARATVANSRLVGAVTPEEIDQDKATVATTTASVETAQASIVSFQAAVQRFTDLQNFQKIIAPFPGVITARNVDPGDLLTADNPTTNKELFHLMRTDTLRVFVNVPQVFAAGIKVGQDATVFGREDPQNQHAGKVVRTANALDPNTRTLLTEVDVPNPDDALRPGMFLQVKFVFERQLRVVTIPAAALATRKGDQRVAVLDDQHRVQYRTVQLGRDFGAEVEVVGGLNDGETVVVHPGDDLPEGTVVEPVPLPTT